MKAGKYYIGDLCYALSPEEWGEVYSLVFDEYPYKEGEFILKDEKLIVIYFANHGRGKYYDQYKNEYKIDTGLFGCIEYKYISESEQNNILSTHIYEFFSDFEVRNDQGTLYFGSVVINTNKVNYRNMVNVINRPYGRLIFMGRQGFCRYYWRLFQNGTRIMYAKPDNGILGPVANSPIEYGLPPR